MDIRIFCCIGSLLLATNPANPADITKWVDQDGRTHFGDYAPHGVDSTQVSPEIITTAPSRNNSLKEIMRPGELRMIKNYEKRNERLIKAKKKAMKQTRLNKRSSARTKDRCEHYQDRLDLLRRKLRQGHKRSAKNRIEEQIARQNQRIEEYCN